MGKPVGGFTLIVQNLPGMADSHCRFCTIIEVMQGIIIRCHCLTCLQVNAIRSCPLPRKEANLSLNVSDS